MEDKLDPKMLDNLEMLMVLDVLEEEQNWENIEKMDEEKPNSEENSHE